MHPKFAICRITAISAAACLALLLAAPSANASDHDDTPLLKTVPRHDARLTDLFAFTRGENLVLIVCLDPTVPVAATSYTFAADLSVTINIDHDSAVTFDDPEDLAVYGGTITRPEKIAPDVVFQVTFDSAGTAHLQTDGLAPGNQSQVRFFAGLRDDPFIRGPRIGRNVAALVVELPLRLAVKIRPRPILVWATSSLAGIRGPFVDLGGRSLRSQFVENDLLNTRPPSQHATDMTMNPDVIIYDTTRPSAFPNGRELADDVVDLVGDPRVLDTDSPFPTANDLPFLTEFPYLAAPHAP